LEDTGHDSVVDSFRMMIRVDRRGRGQKTVEKRWRKHVGQIKY
jgi:hypothetical protein